MGPGLLLLMPLTCCVALALDLRTASSPPPAGGDHLLPQSQLHGSQSQLPEAPFQLPGTPYPLVGTQSQEPSIEFQPPITRRPMQEDTTTLLSIQPHQSQPPGIQAQHSSIDSNQSQPPSKVPHQFQYLSGKFHQTEPLNTDSLESQPPNVDSHVDSLESQPPNVDSLESQPPNVDSLESQPPDVDSLESQPPNVDSLESQPLNVDSLESQPPSIESHKSQPPGMKLHRPWPPSSHLRDPTPPESEANLLVNSETTSPAHESGSSNSSPSPWGSEGISESPEWQWPEENKDLPSWGFINSPKSTDLHWEFEREPSTVLRSNWDPDDRSSDLLESDPFQLWSEDVSCWDDYFCEGDEGDLPPPPQPPKFSLPPPPLPPFLPSLAQLARSEHPPDEEACTLCYWALYGNLSSTLLGPHDEWGMGVGGLLAGVAVGSALTGAVLTVVLVRCRRSRALPHKNKQPDPRPLCRTWGKSSGRRNDEPAKPPDTTASGASVYSVWPMKLWRRSSSQEQPLRPTSTYSSENSYSDEPYFNPEGQSSVYSELAQGLNTYSEIPDSNSESIQKRKILESGYENAGYVLSEAPSEIKNGMPASSFASSEYCKLGSSIKSTSISVQGNQSIHNPPRTWHWPMPSTVSANVSIASVRLEDGALRTIPNNFQGLGQTQDSVDFVPNSAYPSCHACISTKNMSILRHSCESSPVLLNSNNLNLIPLLSYNRPAPPDIDSTAQHQATLHSALQGVNGTTQMFQKGPSLKEASLESSCPTSEYV